jgi:hypothetical protein
MATLALFWRVSLIEESIFGIGGRFRLSCLAKLRGPTFFVIRAVAELAYPSMISEKVEIYE